MGAEAGLRQRIRAAIRAAYPAALIVGQPSNGMTGPGRHDLYVVVQGVYVGLEVKTRTGRATQVQVDRLRATRRAGGCAWLVRSTLGSLVAIEAALNIRPRSRYVAEDDFDIDKFMASLKDDPAPEQLALETTAPENLDRPIAGFTPSEEHIAQTASANGTMAGDGEAMGEVPSSTQILSASIDTLSDAVRALQVEMRKFRESRAAPPTAEAEPESVAESPDTLAALLGLGGPEHSAEEPPAEPATAEPPPAKSKRRRT